MAQVASGCSEIDNCPTELLACSVALRKVLQMVTLAPPCECDSCVPKRRLLAVLELTEGLNATPNQMVEELRADLARHAKICQVATIDVQEDSLSKALHASRDHPWLNYDPNAFLPKPFESFLLTGNCPRVGPPPSADHSTRVEVCYVLGCGRSGTTLLAELLSRHGKVLYLNEPRQLWISALPHVDVWSVAAEKRCGKLCLDEEEMEPALSICQAYKELVAQHMGPVNDSPGKFVVVEKFPEHAFRVGFLGQLCDKGLGTQSCSVVHLLREGRAVARSIARFGNPTA
eukprot:3920030-Amphidinium_carterae.1